MARVDLTDQVALVTGSAHRVGRAIALELARAGVNIVVHYRQSPDEVVKDTLRAIKSFGVDAFPVQADISTAEGVDTLFAAAREHFEHLNILVNSASNFQKRPLMDVTLDEWNETLAINLTAPFLCTQRAVAWMHENTPPGGVIINIGDKGADRPWVDYAHHGISKAGLRALTSVSAAACGPEVRVNMVVPGLVMRAESVDEGAWQRYGEATPIGRPGAAEDVARAVVYLASEDYLTGTVIHVDGGERLV